MEDIAMTEVTEAELREIDRRAANHAHAGSTDCFCLDAQHLVAEVRRLCEQVEELEGELRARGERDRG
jgi:hypothetical protein